MSEAGTPNGRYLISKTGVATGDPGRVTVHDLNGGTDERCNVDQVARADRVRFNDLDWAKSKGYRLCEWCFPDAMEPA